MSLFIPEALCWAAVAGLCHPPVRLSLSVSATALRTQPLGTPHLSRRGELPSPSGLHSSTWALRKAEESGLP